MLKSVSSYVVVVPVTFAHRNDPLTRETLVTDEPSSVS